MPLIDGWEDKTAWFINMSAYQDLTITILVTWQMRTICLVNSQEMTDAWQDHPEARFSSYEPLPIISNRTRRLILRDSTDGPTLFACFDMSTSRCKIDFYYPVGNDHEDMDREDLLRYLELGVPWEWPLGRGFS
eukprot:7377334-Prymnesium_polylepis.1